MVDVIYLCRNLMVCVIYDTDIHHIHSFDITVFGGAHMNTQTDYILMYHHVYALANFPKIVSNHTLCWLIGPLIGDCTWLDVLCV